MSFDPAWLFVSLIPSGIGFVAFVYGKKQGRMPHLVAGIALMVYPFFATTLGALCGVGALICLGWWLAVRGGW